MGLNGGSAFQHSEAFSFQVATDNQEETDRYWNASMGNGGQEKDLCPTTSFSATSAVAAS